MWEPDIERGTSLKKLKTWQTISLKRKCRHFDEIFVIGRNECCQIDNFLCSQWQQLIKMIMFPFQYLSAPWEYWGQEKMTFSRVFFQFHFRCGGLLYFDFNSLKIVPKNSIDKKSALVQIMAWHRTGDKPFSELMSTLFTGAYMSHSFSYQWWRVCVDLHNYAFQVISRCVWKSLGEDHWLMRTNMPEAGRY